MHLHYPRRSAEQRAQGDQHVQRERATQPPTKRAVEARASRKPEAIHVTKRPDGWAVKTEGRERAATIKTTKSQAVDVARDTALKTGARVVEHRSDGRIVSNTKPKSPPKRR